MPVRSLTSSVLKWPDARSVDQAVRAWAAALGQRHADIWRIAYIGSYARGDWGVGSDLDILILRDASDTPFAQRGAQWDTLSLPVPAEVHTYTRTEWEAMAAEGRRFYEIAMREAVWVYDRGTR